MTKEEFDNMSLDEICWDLFEGSKHVYSNYAMRQLAKRLIDGGCFGAAGNVLLLLERNRDCSWFKHDFDICTYIPIRTKDDIRDLALTDGKSYFSHSEY